MTNSHELDPAQQKVLHHNLLDCMESGFASRYLTTQREYAQRLARLADLPNEPVAHKLQEESTNTSVAAGAEAPFLFMRRPSNMAEELIALRANPQTGEVLPGSDTQIGLIGGLAGEGQPSGVFTQEDIVLANQAIASQETAGLRAS